MERIPNFTPAHGGWWLVKVLGVRYISEGFSLVVQVHFLEQIGTRDLIFQLIVQGPTTVALGKWKCEGRLSETGDNDLVRELYH